IERRARGADPGHGDGWSLQAGEEAAQRPERGDAAERAEPAELAADHQWGVALRAAEAHVVEDGAAVRRHADVEIGFQVDFHDHRLDEYLPAADVEALAPLDR